MNFDWYVYQAHTIIPAGVFPYQLIRMKPNETIKKPNWYKQACSITRPAEKNLVLKYRHLDDYAATICWQRNRVKFSNVSLDATRNRDNANRWKRRKNHLNDYRTQPIIILPWSFCYCMQLMRNRGKVHFQSTVTQCIKSYSTTVSMTVLC